jgi:chemotaxis protein methyltransferase CheR
VTGLDVDGPALEKARRGLYHQNSLRAVSPALLERHFQQEDGAVRVREPIRRAVTFRGGNLLEPESYAGLAPLDALFCRNVMIYFSDASVQRAVSLFESALAPGGYLFLGHAESLARVASSFAPIRFQGAIVYQKPSEAAR